MARIFVFFGLIASGKSTLAERFAKRYDLPYYNTDRVRKELAGIDVRQRRPDEYDQGIYSREFTLKTYREMLDRAGVAIRKGYKGVVLDGSYHNREERDRVRRLAAEVNASTVFILCRCSEEEVKSRLAERAKDPLAVSDGRWEIYLLQKQAFQPPDELRDEELLILDTGQPVSILLKSLEQTLQKDDQA